MAGRWAGLKAVQSAGQKDALGELMAVQKAATWADELAAVLADQLAA